jgi:hypothetical protein
MVAPAAKPAGTAVLPIAAQPVPVDTQQVADDAEMAALMNGGDNDGTHASVARSMKCIDCGMSQTMLAFTAGYLSVGPTAQRVVHALKGLACRASPSRAR